eukprot:scaffold59836_cov73-Phaeocystis_antarctica.AAC.1
MSFDCGGKKLPPGMQLFYKGVAELPWCVRRVGVGMGLRCISGNCSLRYFCSRRYDIEISNRNPVGMISTCPSVRVLLCIMARLGARTMGMAAPKRPSR